MGISERILFMIQKLSWDDFEDVVCNKKIIGYGAGANAQGMLSDKRFAKYLSQIDCFVDRNAKLHTTWLDAKHKGINVAPLEALDREHKEAYIVIVTLTDYLEVGKMLTEKGYTWFPWTIISTQFRLDALFSEGLGEGVNLFLLNTPDYANLGDHAIAVGEDRYLKNTFGNYYELGTHSCHPMGLQALKPYVKEKDILFFQGGGNIGSLWKVCEEIFRDIIQTFPNNPIIVFPQSVYYGDTEADKAYLEQSKAIYNAHPNLMITVRDKRSYAFVKSTYTCQCMLLPDMVLTLESMDTKERSGVGVLLREDKEQNIPDNYLDIVTQACEQTQQATTMISHHQMEVGVSREERLQHVLEQYASCRLIITDRLHGMVFAALTNTPCIAFDNSYHKVSGLYDAWLAEYKNITVVEAMPLEELEALIEQKLKTTYDKIDTRYFVEKLITLTNYIGDIMGDKHNV